MFAHCCTQQNIRFSKANSKQIAVIEAEKQQLNNNHYYFTLPGDLYKDTNPNKAKDNFQKSLALAKMNGDRMLLQKNWISLSLQFKLGFILSVMYSLH